MRSIILGAILTLGIASFVSAQEADSLVVVHGDWEEQRLERGVELRQIHFEGESLFGSNQFVTIVEIDGDIIGRRRGAKFNVVADELLVATSVFARENDAVAAINGSFFAANMPYNSVDYIRVDGEELAPNSYDASGKRRIHQQGALHIKDGVLSIERPASEDEVASKWEQSLVGEDVLTSGPLLRIDGRDETLDSTSHVTVRHPRSVIATKADGTTMLITIDGRSQSAEGMSLFEVQNLVRWLGVDAALSLDGGGSTTMYTEKFGVVNHPSDNKKFDNKGERTVANAIIVNM